MMCREEIMKGSKVMSGEKKKEREKEIDRQIDREIQTDRQRDRETRLTAYLTE